MRAHQRHRSQRTQNWRGGFNLPKRYLSLQDSRIGYYARLDTGAAAIDQFTGNGSQDGTLTSGATRTNDGGLAYSLDGSNDFIQLPAITMPTNGLSVVAWVKITANRATLFSFAAQDANLRVWNVGTTGSRVPYFQVPLSTGYWQTSGGTALTAGTFTHLAISIDRASSTAKIYVNGVDATPAISGASTAAWATPTGNPTIGRALNIYSDTLIDDWIFFDRAITATEAAQLATARGAAYEEIASSAIIMASHMAVLGA
jgi:hypothetical protein